MGRVVLPAAWRREKGIVPGSRIQIKVDAETLQLKPESAWPTLARKGRLLVHQGEPTADILEHQRQIRDQRNHKIWGL